MATTAYVDTGLSNRLSLSGGEISGSVSLVGAFGVGAASVGVSVRNTQNGDAFLSMGANNRTSSLSRVGQNIAGNTFLSTGGQNWVFSTDGNTHLPGNGVLYANGEVFHSGYSTTMTNIVDRSRKVRLSREQYQSVNVNGWNNVPSGAVITGLYRGGNGQIEGMNYRYIHQTDINGTWQFVAME